MQLTYTFSIFTLVTLITAQVVPLETATETISPQSSRAFEDLQSYLESIDSPELNAAAEEVLGAMPTTVAQDFISDPPEFLLTAFRASTYPSWWSAVPTNHQVFWSSVGKQANSIIRDDLKPTKTVTATAKKGGEDGTATVTSTDREGAGPTCGVKAAGMLLAAGAAGLVVL